MVVKLRFAAIAKFTFYIVIGVWGFHLSKVESAIGGIAKTQSGLNY